MWRKQQRFFLYNAHLNLLAVYTINIYVILSLQERFLFCFLDGDRRLWIWRRLYNVSCICSQCTQHIYVILSLQEFFSGVNRFVAVGMNDILPKIWTLFHYTYSPFSRHIFKKSFSFFKNFLCWKPTDPFLVACIIGILPNSWTLFYYTRNNMPLCLDRIFFLV